MNITGITIAGVALTAITVSFLLPSKQLSERKQRAIFAHNCLISGLTLQACTFMLSQDIRLREAEAAATSAQITSGIALGLGIGMATTGGRR